MLIGRTNEFYKDVSYYLINIFGQSNFNEFLQNNCETIIKMD